MHLGYGYGQSGVALFFLRLQQLSGREDVLSRGKQALEFDLSFGITAESGVLCFPHTTAEPTAIPYLEEGCAGIAKVAIRYGIWDRMEMMMAEVHRKYVSFPGLLFGLGSFIDVFTDAYMFSGNATYLEMAKRPISGLADMYFLNRPEGVTTPGDGLFRVSCDYATGTAGVMRTLHRFMHHDDADFMLDDVVASPSITAEQTPAIELHLR